jgi:peptidoglycan/LPS O-acetylase OafA/YrhL
LLWAEPGTRQRIRVALTGHWGPLLVLAGLFLTLLTLGSPAAMPSLKRSMFWDFRQPFFSILAATLVLAMLVNPTAGLVRVLSTPILVWLGKLSYSLYLWHAAAYQFWPWMVSHLHLPEILQSPTCTELGRFGMCLLIASTSYYLVERPGLLIKKRWEKAKLGDPAPLESRRSPLGQAA